MGFIKKNAFLLACALVGVASLGLMLWGMSRMSAVKGEMNHAVQLNQQLSGFTQNAVNTDMIDYEVERVNLIRTHHKEALAHFGERNERKPLLDSLLPDPPKGPEGKKVRYEFQRRYREAMADILKQLHACRPPTKEEIDNTADYLKKRSMEAEQFGEAGVGEAGSAGPASAGRSSRAGAPGESEKPDQLPAQDGPASTAAYWDAVAKRAEADPNMLTSIGKARAYNCYANLDRGGSFELHPIFLSGDDSAPNMGEIWYAQLWYWLQKDVVDAIAQVNDEAARQLDAPWVGNLPVKDILSIRVSDYILEGDAPSGADRGESGDSPPTAQHDVWTHQATHTLYDVINLRVRLVIDQRDLPLILDALCHDRYYALLNVQYRAVPPNPALRGKIYGPDPVVEVTLDVQTYLFYKAYVIWMPEVIREELGVEEQFQQLVKEREQEDEAEDGDAT